MISAISPPRFELSIEGARLDTKAVGLVRSLRLVERLSRPAQLEIELAEASLPESRIPKVRIGSPLELRGTDRPVVLFGGDVTAMEYVVGPGGARRWYVRAYDALHRLGLRRTMRAVAGSTAASLARDLTADLGLSVEADEEGPRIPYRVQSGISDLEFLKEVCEEAGLCFTLRDRTLRLGSPKGFGAPIELRVGTELVEACVEKNGSIQTGSVSAIGWSHYDAEPHRGAGGGQAALGSLVPASIAAPGAVESEVTIVGRAFISEDDATAAAQARRLFHDQASSTVEGSAIGDPSLRAGARIEIRGLPEEFATSFTIVECTHRIDGDGFYRTDFSTAPTPSSREDGALRGPTLGRVIDVSDPERLGRVRIAYSALGDLESDWLPVVCPGAGRAKGFIALPNVDDRVLVIPVDRDPARAVVLGGLFGAEPPEDSGVRDGSTRAHIWRTSDGHEVSMDDENGILAFQSKSGHRVELKPDGMVLHAERDLLIEAPGRHLVIRADRIDFKRG